MSAQPNVSYEQVIEIVDQWPVEQQRALITHLQERTESETLTAAEKMALLRSVMFDIPVINDISNRREDWYDDDGR